MKRLIAALVLLVAFPQASPQPINIPIQNPSFETSYNLPSTTDCGTYYIGTTSGVPSWAVTSVWNSSSGIGMLQPTCIVPPDGNKILVLQDVAVSQDLGDVYTILPHDANGDVVGLLTLRISAANRFYWYQGHYKVTLTVKNMTTGYVFPLCSAPGWGAGDFLEIIITCPMQRNPGELFITLASGSGTGEPSGNGYPNLFDAVSLTFTPN